MKGKSVKEETPRQSEIGRAGAAAWETLSVLARELEWAEAYAADRPGCAMGRVYLDFLRREAAAWETAAP